MLFKQERYTRNYERFTLYKFRSMVVDAEKDGALLTRPNDERITPFGKFIRATRIDELPQFFNILHGEMSLVGPRAERTENVEFYCERMPEFRYRMKVKAGLNEQGKGRAREAPGRRAPRKSEAPQSAGAGSRLS